MKAFNLYSAIVSSAALVVFAAGCNNQDFAGTTYSRDNARQGHQVVFATIVNIDEVSIEGTEGTMGAIGGGLLGAALGNTIGGGSGKLVAQVAGGVGGAVAGSKIESAVTRKRALEITIQYPDGKLDAIVQEPGTDVFQLGQQVRVLTNADGTRRVRPTMAVAPAQLQRTPEAGPQVL